MLPNRFILEVNSLLIPPLHFLYDMIDRKFQQYVEGDLVNYNIRAWRNKYNPIRFKKHRDPFSVLTLKSLEAGFVVCLIPLVLSILVFVIELISPKF